MKASRILIPLAVVALFVPLAPAASDVTKNDFGILAGYYGPTTDSTIQGVKTEADGTVDYGLQYRHKFMESNRLSLGLSVLYAQIDIKAGGPRLGTVDNIPFLVDLNWHFLEKRSLFIGVTGGYSMWGDLNPDAGGPAIKLKDSALYGVNLGWDINLGAHWAILTNVRYLFQKVDTDDSNVPDESIDVNPVIANIGVAYRF